MSSTSIPLRKGPSGPRAPLFGPDLFVKPDRIDCSVNAAYVEALYSDSPVLHARSGGNIAGGYNGGGAGNKCVIGFRVGNLLPLTEFSGISYTWLDLNPATPGLSVYANFVLDLNGDGSAFRIVVVDPASLAVLNNGTTVLNPDGSKTTTFDASTMNLLVVNGLPVPPLPPGGPGFVPPTVPGAPLPGGWVSNSYSISAILAAYPDCRFSEAASGDGGLPISPNVTPAFLLGTGDSGNQLIRAFRLSSVKFDGVLV